MKKILGVLTAVAVLAVASQAIAGPQFPEKGWHKGPYITANVGMMQATNDKHAVTQRKFDSSIDPSFGLTFGWDIADWIGPMLQINYAFATGQVGDPNNAAAAVTYPAVGLTFPAGTFPVQNATQHVINLGLYARATLPYFTKASWQGKNVKFIPYMKLGGMGHGMYVNAASTNNKIGAYGGGIGLGAGAELFIWKGFMFALDVTEHIIFQQSVSKNITDVNGVSQPVKILKGGTEFQFNVQGLIGWHF